MKSISFPIIALLVTSMVSSTAFAQTTSDGLAWRSVAEKLEGGTIIDMRLRNGQHFKATFIAAQDDGISLQRKARIPVVIERVPYDTVASLSRAESASMSGAKIAGIVLGSVGAVFGVLVLIGLAIGD